MRIRDVIHESNIPRAETELLLAHVLEQSRTWVLAHADETLPASAEQKLQTLITRRQQHEPLAYLLGEREFYGRPFTVTPDVLIPRPATETLITAVEDFLHGREQREYQADTGVIIVTGRLHNTAPNLLADVGTGSGCIAVTLALEHEMQSIMATDNSPAALQVARENVRRHGVGNRVEVLEGDLLEPLADVQQPFLLVSNPPYVPEGEELMPDVARYEPSNALYSGADGGNAVRALVAAARKHPHCVGFCLECRCEHAILAA